MADNNPRMKLVVTTLDDAGDEVSTVVFYADEFEMTQGISEIDSTDDGWVRHRVTGRISFRGYCSKWEMKGPANLATPDNCA